MNIALWIVATLLGLVFALAGAMKLRKRKDQLLEMDPTNMGWTEQFTDGQINVISALELLGGIGLVLPAVVGVAPVLVPVAAVGIAVNQLGAVVVHVRRGEPNLIARNVIFVALALFVAWGRFGDYSF